MLLVLNASLDARVDVALAIATLALSRSLTRELDPRDLGERELCQAGAPIPVT